MPNLRIDFTGIQALIKTFDADLKDIPRNKQREMILCAAKYVSAEVKKQVSDKLMGRYSLGEAKGGLKASVFIDETHMGDSSPYAEIRFKGTVSRYYEPRTSHPRKLKMGDKQYKWFTSKKTGVTNNSTRRIEEIAFINEYGVPNREIKPRPFMKESMQVGMANALAELLDILEDFITERIMKAI